MGFQERRAEADAMRAEGHDEAAAIHEIESLIDEDELTTKDAEDERQSREAAAEMEKLSDDHMGGRPDGDETEADDEADYLDEADNDVEADAAEDEDGPARLELDDETLESLVTIKVNGEEIDVPLREALEGQMRHSAFTKKTQDLAEQRKAVEAARQAHEEMIETYLAGDNLTPGQRQAFQANYKAIQQEKAREAEAALKTRAKHEQAKLVEAMGWADAKPEDVKAEQAQLRETAEAYGYSADEVTGTVDHRAILLLRDAMKYRQITAKGEQVRQKAKKPGVTLKPGSTATRSSSSKREKQKAWSRHEKQGSLRSAAAAFETLLGDD